MATPRRRLSSAQGGTDDRTARAPEGLLPGDARIDPPTRSCLRSEHGGREGRAPWRPDADWLARWEAKILASARARYCDTETGEEIGWLISSFLDGFRYGWLATGDVRWVERLVDWTDAWIRRGVREPDGYLGWPKGGSGGKRSSELQADSLLGEAMALRPIVLKLIVSIPKTCEVTRRPGAG
jgi:hypothetical protein